MTEVRINLYSDTQTKPTPEMRAAMAAAEVGDEQRGEDPSVNRLTAMTAELLGKEAAVFLPSGTMCNQIAVLLHCRPGDEILTDRTSHIVNAEAGGAAALAGAMVRTLDGVHGVFSAEQLEEGVRAKSRHAPRSRLVAVEQTSNQGGGTVWPLATLGEVAAVARRHGLALHMDGARLLNATVASGVTAAEFAQPFDTVWVDLSKGLGCPVGAVLAGSSEAIGEAWQWKQRLGGAMRQAGVIAAAGIYALEHHVERLAEDHANARHFAERIATVVRNITAQVRQYLVTKTLISAATGFLIFLILWILGVDFPLLWGFLAFLLNFIPNIGSLLAVFLPFLLSLLQFDTLTRPILALILMETVQIVMGNVIEPRMMAFSLNLSPLLVLVSLIFWGSLWGIVGMVLAVPLTATVKIFLENIEPLRPVAVLMGGEIKAKGGKD